MERDAQHPLLALWLQRGVFGVALIAALGTSLACGSTTTATSVRIKQNAWLADPAPRAVGEMTAPGEVHLEAGYDRTFAAVGPNRDNGGNGHSSTVDTLHARIAGGLGRAVELGGFLEAGLNSRTGAPDITTHSTDAGPIWGGLSFRGSPWRRGHARLIGSFEFAFGSVPWVREVHLAQTSTYQSGLYPHSTDVTTSTQDSIDRGWSFGSRLSVGVHGDFDLFPGISLQLGGFAGFLPYAPGVQVAASFCSGVIAEHCDGSTNVSVLSYAGFIMPTATLTANFGRVQLVATGWWLAASAANLEQTAPAGVSLGLRAVL